MFAAFACTVLFAGPAWSQDKFELFGGYSFVPSTVPFMMPLLCPPEVVCPPQAGTAHPVLNGWEFSGVNNFHLGLGVAADVGGSYGQFGASGKYTGAPTHLLTYMFGPQYRFPGRISPFVHALIGGAHETVGASALGISVPSSSNGFAAALGGGLDIKLNRLVWLRAIQLDYLSTRFQSARQNQVRISTGLAFHF
jgi:hypothetical protein